MCTLTDAVLQWSTGSVSNCATLARCGLLLQTSSVVCRSVCRLNDRDAVLGVDSGGFKQAHWLIRLNGPCAAAMQPYVKLRRSLVIIYYILRTAGKDAKYYDHGVSMSVCPLALLENHMSKFNEIFYTSYV